MFLRYYTILPIPAERVEGVVLDEPASWMAQDMVEAERSVEELLGSVGREAGEVSLPRFTDLEIGEPTQLGVTSIVPLSWRASGPDGAYVALDADLEVASLGAGAAQLGISARYLAPVDETVGTFDARLLHRLIEIVIKAFLDRVAARVEVVTLV